MRPFPFLVALLFVIAGLACPSFADQTYYQINFVQTSGDQVDLPTGSFRYDSSNNQVTILVQWDGFPYDYLLADPSYPATLSGCNGSGPSEVFQLLSGGCSGGSPQWHAYTEPLDTQFQFLAPDGIVAFFDDLNGVGPDISASGTYTIEQTTPPPPPPTPTPEPSTSLLFLSGWAIAYSRMAWRKSGRRTNERREKT